LLFEFQAGSQAAIAAANIDPDTKNATNYHAFNKAHDADVVVDAQVDAASKTNTVGPPHRLM
jgi:hypothetical protein